jgi:hypothetical protein
MSAGIFLSGGPDPGPQGSVSPPAGVRISALSTIPATRTRPPAGRSLDPDYGMHRLNMLNHVKAYGGPLAPSKRLLPSWSGTGSVSGGRILSMNSRIPYPCLDEMRRYRAFPCSRCMAPRCWMGTKPSGPKPVLHPGQRACEDCGTPFARSGRTRYCTETCRHRAMIRRRRARRVRIGVGVE